MKHIGWCIKQGTIVLPFTCQSTRRETIREWDADRALAHCPDYETDRKAGHVKAVKVYCDA